MTRSVNKVSGIGNRGDAPVVSNFLAGIHKCLVTPKRQAKGGRMRQNNRPDQCKIVRKSDFNVGCGSFLYVLGRMAFVFMLPFLVSVNAQAVWAQGFGNTGRELTYGFGDTTKGLQRDAETFGFVGREFDAHVGIDIDAPAGTPVYASAEGEVTSPGSVCKRGRDNW